jgi:uncharacterized protein YdhG (YjbR/CyaY superfamily)
MKITKITPGTKFETVEQYFSIFPASTQVRLKEMKKIIEEAAPGAVEVISYIMQLMRNILGFILQVLVSLPSKKR